MLANPRWTFLDSLLVAVLALLSLNVGEPIGNSAGAGVSVSEERSALSRVLETPIPDPTNVVARGGPVLLDAAVRCLGLTQARQAAHCANADGSDCRAARARKVAMNQSLWVRDRQGHRPQAMLKRVARYADAYAIFAQSEAPDRATALLRRDEATCDRHQRYFASVAGGAVELAQD